MQQTYFIQCEETGYIKIGTSVDPKKRLSSLQTANPGTLKLLGVTTEEEFSLHVKFHKYNVRGEWFKPTTELLDYIKSIGLLPTDFIPKTTIPKKLFSDKDQIVLAFKKELEDLGYKNIIIHTPQHHKFGGRMLCESSSPRGSDDWWAKRYLSREHWFICVASCDGPPHIYVLIEEEELNSDRLEETHELVRSGTIWHEMDVFVLTKNGKFVFKQHMGYPNDEDYQACGPHE